MLCLLVVPAQRFLTDADLPGTEKLSVWPPTDAWLQAKYVQLPHLHPDADGVALKWLPAVCHFLDRESHVSLPSGPQMLRPFSVAFVKGWRRSLAALICCEAIRVLEIPFDELTHNFKARDVSSPTICV